MLVTNSNPMDILGVCLRNDCLVQGTNNLLELIEKMNLRTADEYNSFGDIASGLRVYVEQLKMKNESFHEYIRQIKIEHDVLTRNITRLSTAQSVFKQAMSHRIQGLSAENSHFPRQMSV